MINLVSCDSKPKLVAKPKTYPRVILPLQSYQLYDPINCPFKFDVSKSAIIHIDSNHAKICWFDIFYPNHNCEIDISYYKIEDDNDLRNLINDAYNMTEKHNIKTSSRQEIEFHTSLEVFGLMFESTGPVASPLQWYITDGKKNFVKGAFYINSKVNRDSTDIYYYYYKKDIEKMLNSFKWK